MKGYLRWDYFSKFQKIIGFQDSFTLALVQFYHTLKKILLDMLQVSDTQCMNWQSQQASNVCRILILPIGF